MVEDDREYKNTRPLPLFDEEDLAAEDDQEIDQSNSQSNEEDTQVKGEMNEDDREYQNTRPLQLFDEEDLAVVEDSEEEAQLSHHSSEEEQDIKNSRPLPLFDNEDLTEETVDKIPSQSVSEEETFNVTEVEDISVKHSAQIITTEEVVKDKSKVEDTGETELVIRLVNDVAESRLKVQYSEVILPSTNTFLNNVVTAFMLKNEQLIYDISPVKMDIVKTLIHIFSTDEIGEDFDPTSYKLEAGQNIEDAIAADSMKDPAEITRLGFDSIKYHVHYIDLGNDDGEDGTYYKHYKTEGERIIDGYAGSNYTKEESTMFVLKPRLMNTSPIFIILSKNKVDIRIIFSSDYFESTDFFTFATRPLITKVIERKMKRVNDRIFRPFMLLDTEHQDEGYNLDESNQHINKIFVNTLIKTLNALKKAESSISDIQLDSLAEDDQNMILVAETKEGCADEVTDALEHTVMCIVPHPQDLSSHEANMFEVHIKVLKPHTQHIIKRYPKNSLYDMGLFTKSFARYLADMVSAITAVNDSMVSETLYKNTFPFFVPTMKGIEYKYVNSDIFFMDETKSENVSNRAKLILDLISEDETHSVKTVGFRYGDEVEESSDFASFLKGEAVKIEKPAQKLEKSHE